MKRVRTGCSECIPPYEECGSCDRVCNCSCHSYNRKKSSLVKSVDVPLTTIAPISTPSFTLLNGIKSGSNFYNFVGNTYKSVSLEFNAAISFNSGSPATPEYIRMLIFYDRQPNGAVPAITDLLGSFDLTGAQTHVSIAFPNPNNKYRFKILMDHRIPIWYSDDAAASNLNLQNMVGSEMNIQKYIPLRLDHESTGVNGTITDITKGSIYLLLLNSTATTGFGISFTSRFTYMD